MLHPSALVTVYVQARRAYCGDGGMVCAGLAVCIYIGLHSSDNKASVCVSLVWLRSDDVESPQEVVVLEVSEICPTAAGLILIPLV
jgi:hypothetical protein